MTNVLFLTFYYAMLFPAGFFWAAATLFVHYWTDKFCILRVWAPSSVLGNEIADLSRYYFFTAALIVYSVMSSYNFASFPYDNACGEFDGVAVKKISTTIYVSYNLTLPTPVAFAVLDEALPSAYIGSFDTTNGAGESVSFDISEGDQVFAYCNQDMLRYKPWPAVPAVPSRQPKGEEWMTEDQQFLKIYGWTGLFVALFVAAIMINLSRRRIMKFFFGEKHYCSNNNKTKKFSENLDIFAYIPQVKVSGALYPVLFCDVSEIDHELIGWEDPEDKKKSAHNAIFDVPGLSESGAFSVIKQWVEPETAD